MEIEVEGTLYNILFVSVLLKFTPTISLFSFLTISNILFIFSSSIDSFIDSLIIIVDSSTDLFFAYSNSIVLLFSVKSFINMYVKISIITNIKIILSSFFINNDFRNFIFCLVIVKYIKKEAINASLLDYIPFKY